MTHSQLIARLEQLTGPDREVDRDIALAIIPGSRVAPRDNDRVFIPEKGWEPGAYSIIVLAYTASVDAALELAEKVLPNKWNDILREALSAMSRAHYWHIEHVKQGQLTDYLAKSA